MLDFFYAGVMTAWLVYSFVFVYQNRIQYLEYIDDYLDYMEKSERVIILDNEKNKVRKKFITKSVFCVVYTWISGNFVTVSHNIKNYICVDFGTISLEKVEGIYDRKNKKTKAKERKSSSKT